MSIRWRGTTVEPEIDDCAGVRLWDVAAFVLPLGDHEMVVRRL